MKKVIILACLNQILVAQEVGARYLIITHDNFYNCILPLAPGNTKRE